MENITTIKVKVTKEILEKSMMCGTKNSTGFIAQNCALALAIREIFLLAVVGRNHFHPIIYLPDISCEHNGKKFIEKFDISTPKKRLDLPETEVELYLTDEVIDELNKRENFNWKEVVNNSEILELV